MFTDVLNHADLTHWAEIGLVIFFAVFVGASIWTLTQPAKVVREWARLPLEDRRPGDRHD